MLKEVTITQPKTQEDGVTTQPIPKKKSEATNQQLEGATSQQLEGATSQQLEGATNQQLKGATNQQLKGATSQQLEGATNQQLKGATNQQLEGAPCSTACTTQIRPEAERLAYWSCNAKYHFNCMKSNRTQIVRTKTSQVWQCTHCSL